MSQPTNIYYIFNGKVPVTLNRFYHATEKKMNLKMFTVFKADGLDVPSDLTEGEEDKVIQQLLAALENSILEMCWYYVQKQMSELIKEAEFNESRDS